MKSYTLGEVLDNLQMGEVAIRVEEADITGLPVNKAAYSKGLYWDEDTRILKSLGGNNVTMVKTISNKGNKFVIIPKEVYKELKTSK